MLRSCPGLSLAYHLPMAEPRTSPSSSPAWDEQKLDNPHAVTDKAVRVQRMFDAIAPSYDLNNRLHSLWRDQAWRKKTVRLSRIQPDDVVLDVACGTGDLTLAYAKARPARVIGLDFTHHMLQIARQKQPHYHSPVPVIFGDGDAMQLPIADASVDVVSIAFGIRNVSDPQRAIHEFARVLRPGGRLAILEFSLPTNPLLLAGYNFYFHQIMPRTATLISGDRSGAYKYLPKSVNTFIGRQEMTAMMETAGFTDVSLTAMTFGIAICYLGIKS